MIKMDWLAASVSLRAGGAALVIFSAVAYSLQVPPANGKQAQAAEEIYQTLLSNRKPGKIDYVHAASTTKPTPFRIKRKKYINCSVT
jgi:hypothetical protein